MWGARLSAQHPGENLRNKKRKEYKIQLKEVYIAIQLIFCEPGTTFSYGSTGCGIFKQGVQKLKDFWKRINIPKGNY